VLIEDGILQGYIQDSMNAAPDEGQADGNGRRESYAAVPMPRMTNTYMLGGDRPKEEIVAGLKRRPYATNFGGGQVDITSGKFVFSASEAVLGREREDPVPGQGRDPDRQRPRRADPRQRHRQRHAPRPGVGVCGKEGQSVPVGRRPADLRSTG
jgi:TldD protein